LVDFTGERVVPGQVSDDLWSEHLARYAFARRYAHGVRVLDAGCGTGYGSAEIAQSARSVIGLDSAPEAIAFATANYPLPRLHFLAASVTALPFPSYAFDLIIAFEVIEHLADYRAFLAESARVLSGQGMLIVSSPNKLYYGETRAETGPNPYHEHEFEADEFVAELSEVFTHVRLVLQNRVESFAFHPATNFWPAEARIDGGAGQASDAHFLIAQCSFGQLPEPRSFVYVPRAANILREREQYIKILQQQLIDLETLRVLYEKQTEELETRTRWAEDLSVELREAGERIVALQDEVVRLAGACQAEIAKLEEQDRVKTTWAQKTASELTAKCQELADCVRLLDATERTVHERTHWAQEEHAHGEELAQQLNLIRSSLWFKIGKRAKLGPS